MATSKSTWTAAGWNIKLFCKQIFFLFLKTMRLLGSKAKKKKKNIIWFFKPIKTDDIHDIPTYDMRYTRVALNDDTDRLFF